MLIYIELKSTSQMRHGIIFWIWLQKQRKKVNGYALDAGRLSNVKTAFHVIDVLIGITYSVRRSVRYHGFADIVFQNTHRL